MSCMCQCCRVLSCAYVGVVCVGAYCRIVVLLLCRCPMWVSNVGVVSACSTAEYDVMTATLPGTELGFRVCERPVGPASVVERPSVLLNDI